MKRIYFVSMLLLACAFAFGQDTTISVMYATTTPEIDGLEDDVWLTVDPVPIELNFGTEEPTVTAYWKAMWDEVAMYVLVYVEDNDHWPSWESGGSWYEYDQPELYFDVNADLKDGLGASSEQGHYQVQPHFEESGYGTAKESAEVNNFRPECYYCYTLDEEENYMWEYELEYTAFTDKGGTVMTLETFRDLEKIGFDVTIIDQDENVTTGRQRKVWANDGATDENYLNMDDAGTIVLADPPAIGMQQLQAEVFKVYPNPVSSLVRIGVDCDRIRITDPVGQTVLFTETTGRWINLESLNPGIYLLEAFSDDRSVGISKIMKK